MCTWHPLTQHTQLHEWLLTIPAGTPHSNVAPTAPAHGACIGSWVSLVTCFARLAEQSRWGWLNCTVTTFVSNMRAHAPSASGCPAGGPGQAVLLHRASAPHDHQQPPQQPAKAWTCSSGAPRYRQPSHSCAWAWCVEGEGHTSTQAALPHAKQAYMSCTAALQQFPTKTAMLQRASMRQQCCFVPLGPPVGLLPCLHAPATNSAQCALHPPPPPL